MVVVVVGCCFTTQVLNERVVYERRRLPPSLATERFLSANLFQHEVGTIFFREEAQKIEKMAPNRPAVRSPNG